MPEGLEDTDKLPRCMKRQLRKVERLERRFEAKELKFQIKVERLYRKLQGHPHEAGPSHG